MKKAVKHSLVSRVTIATLVLTALGLAPTTSNPEPAVAATDLVLENVNNDRVVLGSLASRSQRKPIAKSGSAAPFTYTGTDSTTGETYQFQSDRGYTSGANLRESDERTGTSAQDKLSSYTSAVNQSFQGKTGVLRMQNSGSIDRPNSFGGLTTYGSHFGPDVFTQPFYGTSAESVNFSWWASGSGDEYEIYAFLVNLPGVTQANCTAGAQTGNYGSSSDYSVLAHGRGKTSTAWTLASNALPDDGCYRVRFVHGTYDASGGYVVGALFYVADFQLGLGQTLDFQQPSDVIRSSAAQTFIASITSNAAGAAITLASTTTSVCTVSGRTVTIKANASGTCTLRADSGAVGSYGAAASVFRSFAVRTSASKPVSNGGDLITGTRTVCNALTAQLGTWGDGGSAITSTTYQWKRGGVAIAGATSDSYSPVAQDSGQEISFTVTRTNAIGSTSANSNTVTVQDLRLASVDVGGGNLTPAFDDCSFAYSTVVATPVITITPTLTDPSQTVNVSGSAVVSGQPSQRLSLNPGANTISVVVSNGPLSSTTVFSVEYAPNPLAETRAVSNLDGNAATLNGRGTANSSSSVVAEFLWYGRDPSSSPTAVSATPSTVTGFSSQDFSFNQTGLDGGTPYYYSFRMGDQESQILSFTTPAAPIVATVGASDIEKTAATVSANVNANSFATSVSFQIATSSALLFSNPTLVNVSPDVTGSSDASSSAQISGLLPGTTYFFRVVGTNSVGTNFGSIETFTTLADAPAVTASAATSIGATSAVLPGTINAQGSDTTNIVLKYSIDAALSSGVVSVTPTPAGAFGNIETVLEYRLSGLAQNTTYYFQYEATNAIGTVASSIVSFQTQAAPEPTIGGETSASTSGQVLISITFSEAVTGLSTSGVALTGDTTGWTMGDILGSGASYTVLLTPDPLVATAGEISVQLAAGAASATSRPSLASNLHQVTITLGISAPNLSYSRPAYEFFVGDAIAVGTPSNSGGAWASISLAPSTYSDIILDQSSGEVSGTSTETLTETVFTVTATNPAGSNSVTFSITIRIKPQSAVPIAYTGPNPVRFVPRVLETETLYTVKVHGSRLDRVTSIEVNGVSLTFRIISPSEVELTVPGLSLGIKEVLFESREGILTYMNALDVRLGTVAPGTESPDSELAPESGSSDEQSPVAPPSSDSWNTTTIWGFVPGKPVLNRVGWGNFSNAFKQVKAAQELMCVGYTMGPTALRRDIQLSHDRAKNVCGRLSDYIPGLKVVSLEGRQDLRLGELVRRVEILWR